MKLAGLTLATCALLGSLADAQARVVHPDRAIEPTVPTSAARFGRSVAVDGDRLLVGASEASIFGRASGLAYLFERQGDGSWLEVDQFAPLAPTPSLVRFGSHVALDGDVAVVASGATATPGPYVSIFERSGGGVWTRTVDLSAPSADDVGFGAAIAVDAGRLVVTTKGSGFLGLNPGRAYVYEEVGGTWSVVGSVNATVAGLDSGFGTTVALSGDRLALGQRTDGAGGATGAGTVLVAERQTNGAWLVTDTVVDPTPGIGAAFGAKVALEGERLVVGAWNGDAAAIDGGEVHVYARQANATWLHEAEITASDAAVADAFGAALALDGDTLVVGAPGAQAANGTNAGAAYLFERRPDGTWFQSARVEHEFPTSFDALSNFASNSIATDDGHVFLGTEGRDGFEGEVSELDLLPLLHGDTLIFASTGGAQSYEIRAGASRAGDAYLVLGSVTGDAPAIDLGGGVFLPLVLDAYTLQTAAFNAPILGAFGPLGPDGEASAIYYATQSVATTFVGVVAYHAVLTIDLVTFEVWTTNAVAVELVP